MKCSQDARVPLLGERGRSLGSSEGLWCRDSTWRFLPVMSQKRHMFSLFSWFNPLPSICGSLAVLAKPEADLAVWVFLRVAKTRWSVLDSHARAAPSERVWLSPSLNEAGGASTKPP